MLMMLATSQILMIHSAALVMKMDGLKVFHSTLYTGAWCALNLIFGEVKLVV